MNLLVLDTNALISYVTDRDPDQQAKIAVLIERAARADVNLLCPQNVLTEFAYVMNRIYGVESKRVAMMLVDLIDLPGVEVVDALDYSRLVALWPTRISDYGDAMVAAVCLSRKGSAVVTFDRKLRTSLRRARVPLAVSG